MYASSEQVYTAKLVTLHKVPGTYYMYCPKGTYFNVLRCFTTSGSASAVAASSPILVNSFLSISCLDEDKQKQV